MINLAIYMQGEVDLSWQMLKAKPIIKICVFSDFLQQLQMSFFFKNWLKGVGGDVDNNEVITVGQRILQIMHLMPLPHRSQSWILSSLDQNTKDHDHRLRLEQLAYRLKKPQ